MNIIQKFLKLEASTGIVLSLAAILAILFKNSALQEYYNTLINYPLSFSLLGLSFNKSLLVWVNDFLMAFFFLLVGLELKREILEGHLMKLKDCILPAIAALGGFVFPAIIYSFFTLNDTVALKGWAVPVATDIAFAMGVIALLGTRIPKSLKICLLSLAIFDDIMAIIVIALFYTSHISIYWLTATLVPILMLGIFNRKQVKHLTCYLVPGFFLWLFFLKSGVHATVSGIVLAAFVPISIASSTLSPLKNLETRLHPWVTYLVLPVFAFFNAGVPLQNLSLNAIYHPVAIGIILGLFLGKQLGVMLFSFIAIKLKICSLPGQTSWGQYYGMAILTGIGFTMSLFIGFLSFSSVEHQNIVRFGVIVGSVLSGFLGYFVLFCLSGKSKLAHDE